MLQLTEAEKELIDQVVRKDRRSPVQAFRAVNKERQKHGEGHVNKAIIYRFVNGMTHGRNRRETRGRASLLTDAEVKDALATRRRLIKEASGGKRVTWADVHKASGLKRKVSQRA